MNTTLMTDKANRDLLIWLGIVLVVAISLRIILFMTYPSVSYSDTASYRRSAEAILSGLSDYDGTRTPGYPAWMALIGADRAVYAAQLVLGLGITLAWFLIGWKSTAKPWFGGLTALAHTLNPGQFFFEANLLTETLSTFWLVLALFGAFLWLEFPKYRTFWMGLGIGLTAALATLTRPLFIFMPVWLAICLAFSIEGQRLRFNWKPLAAVLLPAILMIGGWMRWIQTNYHVFSLTTMTGYHLVQHTGYYFEDVPDEYADIREVYLNYRETRLAERGTQGNAIWDAIPEMQAVSGLNFYELSRTLQKISIDLILTHPGSFILRVLKGWWLFWRAPVYWDANGIAFPGLTSIIRFLILGARGLLFVINLVFVFSSLAALASKRLRKIWALRPFHGLFAGSVWATSVVSSMMDHGDNPRFLVPLQTVVVFLVLWVVYQTIKMILHPKENEDVRDAA